MKKTIIASVFGLACVVIAPSAKAASILVAECIENAPCWDGPTVPWSNTLTDSQIASLGSSLDVIAAQTSESVMRLGVTTIVFDTGGGPVTETLAEFNGVGTHNDPCAGFCEVGTVGTFTVPAGALSATISGTFGNSTIDSTAGVCIFLGSTSSCAGGPGEVPTVPEPAGVLYLGTGLASLGFLTYRLRGRRD